MAFALKDIRYTARRVQSGREMLLYPRLLRDRSILPKIDMATQYFESMLGRERRELEAEVLYHFFGDHKLARCLVACLGRSYRYHSPRVYEAVLPAAWGRLQRAGLDTPSALRLWLFDRVNDFGFGYIPRSERDATFATAERELGLRSGELERLLTLDADEHAVLVRLGAEPRPADVLAQYNFAVLESLLRHAERVELVLNERSAEQARAAVALCGANGVEARLDVLGGRTGLEILGRQDALGVWARHGRRVARSVVQLLERGRPSVEDGHALLETGGRRVRLRLTEEVLDILAGAPAPAIGWGDAPGWEQATIAEGLRQSWSVRGDWRARRTPDAQAWSAGVVVPELMLRRGEQGWLVCAVRSEAHAARLAPMAQAANTGEQLVFVGAEQAVGPLDAVGALVAPCPAFEPATVLEALSNSSTHRPLRPAAPQRRLGG